MPSPLQSNLAQRDRSPFRTNARKEGKDDFGFNAKTDTYESMYEAGVIDPTKVTRVALGDAGSVAGLLLTTEDTMTEIPKHESTMPAPGMGGRMGMM